MISGEGVALEHSGQAVYLLMEFCHRPGEIVKRQVWIFAFSHIRIVSVFEERELIIFGEITHDGMCFL